MSNTPLGLSAKAVVLLVLVTSIYYFDFPKWGVSLVPPQAQVDLLLALTAFAVGIITGRRALRALFDISETGFARGLLVISLSALLYVLGSYSPYTSWLHYESLLLLVSGYLILRVGASLVRFLSPFLIVLAFALQPVGRTPMDSLVWVSLLSAAVMAAAPLRFGDRPNLLSPMLLTIPISIAAWLLAGMGAWAYLRFLIPMPLLLFLVPRFKRFSQPKDGSLELPCSLHRPIASGFCSMCGRKVNYSPTPENSGGWGLVAVCALAFVLIVSSMPLLALGPGGYEADYTARGVSLQALPVTPQGWQINSTLVDSWNPAHKTFETVRVYAPVVNPETNNCTVFYSVSPVVSVPVAPWQNVTVWKWIGSDFVPMAGFQGRLTTYIYGNNTILSYSGTRSMTFVDGLGFSTKTVAVGYLKVFKNLNISADKSDFLGELGSVWTPPLAANSFRSDWTGFVQDIIAGLWTTFPLVEVTASVSVLGWIAYKVIAAEEALDRFYQYASLATEKKWCVLRELLNTPKRMARGVELRRSTERFGVEEIDSAIRTLEEDGLVRQQIVTSGNDVRLLWKARA